MADRDRLAFERSGASPPLQGHQAAAYLRVVRGDEQVVYVPGEQLPAEVVELLRDHGAYDPASGAYVVTVPTPEATPRSKPRRRS
jgi:hypothetical protein